MFSRLNCTFWPLATLACTNIRHTRLLSPSALPRSSALRKLACFGFRPALTFFFSALLDLRIYRTSALLFILFALGIFELGIYGIWIFGLIGWVIWDVAAASAPCWCLCRHFFPKDFSTRKWGSHFEKCFPDFSARTHRAYLSGARRAEKSGK